jgi:hypothetical protein
MAAAGRPDLTQCRRRIAVMRRGPNGQTSVRAYKLNLLRDFSALGTAAEDSDAGAELAL